MEDIIALICNQGFSVVIAIFLLVRMESKIEQLNDTINELSKSIIKKKLLDENERLTNN